MADNSAIEWTDATWNPATGCTKVSEGCDYCYAEETAKRLHNNYDQYKYRNGFYYTEHESDLNKPLLWKKPKKIFVNSMSDLFHEKATYPFVKSVLDTMLLADHHIYQILTKRPRRMNKLIERWLQDVDMPQVPIHIWLGVSIENDENISRLFALRWVPAKIRFISFEPLLGPINHPDLEGINWAIIGGESGKKHRPPKKEWITDLIALCQTHKVPVFFKQWGGLYPKEGGNEIDGKTIQEWPKYLQHKDRVEGQTTLM